VYFTQVLQPNAGQGEQVLFDTQDNFSHDVQVFVLQQTVIGQNATGNRVFDGHHGSVGLLSVAGHNSELIKGFCRYNPDVLTPEVSGGNVVKRALYALNDDTGLSTFRGRRIIRRRCGIHIFFFVWVKKKRELREELPFL
jgi:hypothetical protein